MKIFRFYLSLLIAKLAYTFLKITKLSSGTAIIGLLTLKICPDFLLHYNKYIKKSFINITGTNGKTTTSGILAHLVKNDKNTLIYNHLGANMLNGIVNALAIQLNPYKKTEFSIIETDEAFLEKVYQKINSDYLLVTNLFEDQTDRFSTPIFTRDLIQKGIDKKEDLQLILNADDPISSSLKSKNKKPIYFSIEKVIDENGNTIEYNKANYKCPICDNVMEYTKNFYSHLGDFACSCGYKKAEAKYRATVQILKTSLLITLENESYEVPLTGLYNAYNAIGAIVLAKELGINNIVDSIKTFKVAFGRNEKKILMGHETTIQLIKNPAGTNEILKNINTDSHILIAINNNEADGKDISWINQVEFEKLANTKKEIIVTGMCCNEMTERLQKAGIERIKTISDIKNAIKYIGKTAQNDITILTTYTALLKINKIKEIKKCC